MLALSDQQLITGISLLIATYARLCVISGYSFQVVAASAWFSCTTHLSTLTVLRKYFDEHKVLRTVRVVIMVILFLFLSVTLVLTQMTNGQLGSLFTCNLQPLSGEANPLYKVGIVASMLTFLIWLIYGYGRAITEIYSERYRTSTENWLAWAIINSMLPESAPWPKKRRLIVSETLHKSFLWQIILLWLYLTYGLAIMLSALVPPESDIFKVGGMGFGQILPLSLLALPILTACEAYYGM
jgi:hypothetical protein